MGAERPSRQLRARGELGVRALGATVGRLDRTEQLLLQDVGVLVIELLVGLAQAGHRVSDLLDGNREVAQNLLSAFGGRVCHLSKRLVRSRVEIENARSSSR